MYTRYVRILCNKPLVGSDAQLVQVGLGDLVLHCDQRYIHDTSLYVQRLRFATQQTDR